MSKGLDYLDKILNYQPLTLVERTIIEDIKEKLQRLEAIDNADTSRALECLERINNYGCGINDNMKFSEVFEKEYNTIKQALKPKSKKELAWDIVKEKRINLEYFIKDFINDNYNYTFYKAYSKRYGAYQLTEKEFNLLKEGLE